MMRRFGRRGLLKLIVLLLLAGGGVAALRSERPPLPDIGVPRGSPEAIAWPIRWAMDRVLDFRVLSGARSGYVALVARGGELVYARTLGLADIETERPMAIDTRFHIASMTKPVTAVAAMILVAEGRLDLDAPLHEYLPEFSKLRVVDERSPDGEWTTRPLERPLLVRHLLCFEAGIGGYAETDDPLDLAWRSPDIEAAGLGGLAERVALIPRLPLYEPPGERWRYGWSLDVVARLVEVVAEKPFGQFARARIFDPLEMRDTAWPDDLPPGAPIASMYSHDESGRLVRHGRFDEYYGQGWASGGGGLVSTAPDYMRFALMLRNRGEWKGRRILPVEVVDQMMSPQSMAGVLAEEDLEGLAWGYGGSVVADDALSSIPGLLGDYWWSGRFGTHFVISPRSDTVLVVMQQTERGPYSDRPLAPWILQWLAIR